MIYVSAARAYHRARRLQMRDQACGLAMCWPKLGRFVVGKGDVQMQRALAVLLMIVAILAAGPALTSSSTATATIGTTR
jgi:hypothetical protein